MTPAQEWTVHSELPFHRSRPGQTSGPARSQTKLEELITGAAFEPLGVPRDAAPRARILRTRVGNTCS
jgi:hypothetical protein